MNFQTTHPKRESERELKHTPLEVIPKYTLAIRLSSSSPPRDGKCSVPLPSLLFLLKPILFKPILVESPLHLYRAMPKPIWASHHTHPWNFLKPIPQTHYTLCVPLWQTHHSDEPIPQTHHRRHWSSSSTPNTNRNLDPISTSLNLPLSFPQSFTLSSSPSLFDRVWKFNGFILIFVSLKSLYLAILYYKFFWKLRKWLRNVKNL